MKEEHLFSWELWSFWSRVEVPLAACNISVGTDQNLGGVCLGI